MLKARMLYRRSYSRPVGSYFNRGYILICMKDKKFMLIYFSQILIRLLPKIYSITALDFS